MTREEFVRNRSWILRVIRSRCELTQTEEDYLNDLIEVLEQEPCDCISREETCDYIAEFVNHEYATDREREMVKNIIGGIQHLPSIQPKTDVLDKIRAEIKAISITGHVDEHTMFIRTGEHVKQMALDVIDKYTAEETWEGIHAQVTAPKGTFDKIWNEAEDNDEI